MKKVLIQVEAKAKIMKWIEMPDDEAAEFVKASDEVIIANVDESDISSLEDYEVIEVVAQDT